MKERVQKILSMRGVASRRAGEELIRQGRVAVNGKTVSLGETADPATDRITLDGRPIPNATEHVYLMLYKPRGYITTLSDEKGRKTAADLIDCGCRVYPVGRLDYASEGLLLFTNDGAMAQQLMHPSAEKEKIYEVTVSGALDSALVLLSRSVVLDGRAIRPPKVRLLRQRDTKATYEITIYEGRNRQIRRMCELAGLEVLRLCRTGEAGLSLGKLPVGTWRYLTQEEIAMLKGEIGK